MLEYQMNVEELSDARNIRRKIMKATYILLWIYPEINIRAPTALPKADFFLPYMYTPVTQEKNATLARNVQK